MVTKINISIPEDVLKELDKAATEARTSRSAFLVQAVKRYLEEREGERVRQERLEAAQAIRNLAEQIGPWDGTAEILRWRDKH